MAGWLQAGATVAAATVVLGWWAPISANAANNSPYSNSTSLFTSTPLQTSGAPPQPLSFGQGPSWMTSGAPGGVLSNQLDSGGTLQIYSSTDVHGNGTTCLTCTTVQGPNGLPQERPQGDWILFESYGQQLTTHFGNPGYGGYGGDLYAMHPDGTHVYRLTTTSDPNGGIPYNGLVGTPYDNFHAYWSPDGNHIVWTHLEADSPLAGGEKWEIMLGDFTVNALGVPSLTNVRVVGLPYGAYETEPWSPDGKGFIFFATGGRQSPFQATPPGWGNTRIYYMRVYDASGNLLPTPMVTPLTDNAPNYTEQAVFTPDEQAVIMMTDRNQNATSWTHAVMSTAQNYQFDDPNNLGSTQTLQFIADFAGSGFAADLWIADSSNLGNPHQLTSFGQIVPEFFWNPTYTQLLWTLESSNAADIRSYTGSFSGPGIPASPLTTVPATTPPWLMGTAPVWTRIGAQLQTPTQLGPVNNISIPVLPPLNPAAPFPHASKRTDNQSVPLVTASYLAEWQADLTLLGDESLQPLLAPQGLLRLGGF